MTSKLQFQDLIIGTGKTAERGALITAHYTGYLPEGTVFDSSHHPTLSIDGANAAFSECR